MYKHVCMYINWELHDICSFLFLAQVGIGIIHHVAKLFLYFMHFRVLNGLIYEAIYTICF